MAGLSVQLHRLVLIAVVKDRTVIGGINYERIFREAVLVECCKNPAGLIVERHHGVATRAERGLPCVARMMDARHMVFMRRVIEEEGLVLILRNETTGFLGKSIAHRLVVPDGRLAALHPTNPPHAIHQRHIMAMRPIHFQLGPFSVGLQVGISGVRLLVTNFNWIFRVEANNRTILDKDRGYTITRSRHDIGISEADLIR